MAKDQPTSASGGPCKYFGTGTRKAIQSSTVIVVVLLTVGSIGCTKQPSSQGTIFGVRTTEDATISRLKSEGIEIRSLPNGMVEAIVRQTPKRELTQGQLQQLASITKLERLVFEGEPPSSYELQFFGGSSIKDVVLSGPKFDDSDLETIVAAFPQLESLHLTGTSIVGKSFEVLAGLTRLQLLNLDYSPLEKAAGLRTCPNLNTVIILGCDSPSAFWQDIAKIESLQHLSVAESNFDESALDILADNDLLVSLVLLYCKLNPTMGREIGSIRSLEDIRLAGSDVGDRFVLELSELTKLRSLDLSGTHITNASIKALQELSELEVLDLSDTGVSNEIVEELCSMPNLTSVSLDATKIDQRSREIIKGCLERNWNRKVEREKD